MTDIGRGPDFSPWLTALLDHGASSRPTVRSRAREVVLSLAKVELTLAESTALLRAAPRTTDHLMRGHAVAAATAWPDLVGELSSAFDRLDFDPWAQQFTLAKLVEIDDDPAWDELERLLGRFDPGAIRVGDLFDKAATTGIETRAARLFALPMAEELEPMLASLASRLTLAAPGRLTSEARAAATVMFERVLSRRIEQVAQLQQRDETPFWWAYDGYAEHASPLREIVDAAGVAALPGSLGGELARCASLHDPYLRWAGIGALLRLGHQLDPTDVDAAARFVGTRRDLVETLGSAGAAELVDARWRRPDALAEAFLADWLANPFEAGRIPLIIELVRRHAWRRDDVELEAFFFRFSYEPESGLPWSDEPHLAAVGPFQRGVVAFPSHPQLIAAESRCSATDCAAALSALVEDH